MAADAGLISSFGKLATSDQRDYSGQLRAQREESKIIPQEIDNLSKSIQSRSENKNNARKNELKIQNEKQREINRKAAVEINYNDNLFKKQMQKTSESLKAGGPVGENFSDVITDQITKIKSNQLDQYNTGEKTTENSRGIQTAFNDADQVTKQVVKYRGDLQTISEAVSELNTTSQISTSWDSADKAFVMAASNDATRLLKFDENNIMQVGAKVIIDGEETTRYVPASELMSLCSFKEIKGEDAIVKLDNSVIEGDLEALNKFDFDENTSTILSNVFYPSEGPKPNVADLAGRLLGRRKAEELSDPELDSGKYTPGSWAYALQESPELQGEYWIDDISVYDSAGVVADTGGGEGGKKDGIVSKEEAMVAMMNLENRDKVISTLINPDKEGGNYDLTARYFAKFLSSQQADQNQKAKNDLNNDGKSINNLNNDGKPIKIKWK